MAMGFGKAVLRLFVYVAALCIGRPSLSQTMSGSQSDQTLNIYVPGSYTGIMPFLLDHISKVTAAFAETTNLRGGLFGKKIKVIMQDDRADIETALKNAKIAVEDPNHLVTIGHPFSSVALPVGKYYADHGKLFLTPYATSTEISQIGKTVFQLCFNDKFQGETLADVAVGRLKGRRVLVLRNLADSYSDGLAKDFELAMASHPKGKATQVREFSYIFDKMDFEKLNAEVKDFRPDVIFLPELKVRAGIVLRKLSGLNSAPYQVLGGDGWGAEDEILDMVYGDNYQALTKRFFITSHWHKDVPLKSNKRIMKEISAFKGVIVSGSSVLTYEGLSAVTKAVQSLKTTDNVKISKALRGFEFESSTGKAQFLKDGTTSRGIVLLEIKKDQVAFDSLVKRYEDQ